MKKYLLLILMALVPMLGHGQSNQNNIYGCANTFTYTSGLTPLTPAGAGYTQLLPAPPTNTFLPSRAYHICSFDISIVQPATPVVWGLVTGTGTNCSVNTQPFRAYPGYGTFQSIGQVFQSANTLNAPPNQAVCLYVSGAVPGGVTINATYATQ